MYDKLVTKMKLHFGKDESLIMYSKSCDYYQINPIKIEDVQMYYNYLISEKVQSNQNTINDIACCLYYLSKNNKEYQDKFTSQIIQRLDINKDEINDDTMFLIYNIIEFDEQYLKSEKAYIEYLLAYLERFSAYPKSRTNFILYKYYRGCLKLNLGDLTSANTEYLETVMSYNDEIIEAGKENKYTLFIKLKNDLLNVRITKITEGDDIRQTRIFLKELYDRTKNENQFLSIKIGFEIYDIYLKENKYIDCIDILYDMKASLKKRLLTGFTMNNAIDFYLAIVSRIGYVGILTNKKEEIENSIKKLGKTIEKFNKYCDLNKDKGNIFKIAYIFLLSILKINNNEKVDKLKEIAANFKSFFLPDLKEAQNKKFNNLFIINESNFYDCIVNLDIINNMTYDVDLFWKNNIFSPLLDTVSSNTPLQHKVVITFMLSVHNQINHLTESYCKEFNKKNYKDKIIKISEKAITYVRNYCADEYFFHTEFLKGILINIISAYFHVFLYEKKFENLKNIVKLIDDLNKILKFNENTPSYELLCKIKGDFWLFSSFRDIKASISFYEKAIKIIPNYHPKKSIVLFNVGYCYFLNDDKKNAKNYLDRCIFEINNTFLKSSNLDFYNRPNALKQKMQIAKKMISFIESSQ